MYEDLTVEDVKNDILGRLTSDIDVREGSYHNDTISAVAYKIWESYKTLDSIVPIAYVDKTSGEYIDKRCAEYGIIRKSGTKATTTLSFTGTDGTVIPKAKVFMSTEDLEFTTDESVTITGGAATVTATASETGEAYNVVANTITKQFVNLSGLSSITNTAATGGSNAETDESLVTRLYNYLQKPATSGNANHYKQWALAVDGVGNAKVIPLWSGPGTVKVLIVGSNKGPVNATIVTNCAAYIEENRPVGATITVESASGLSINVAASISIKATTTKAAVQEAFTKALDTYLQSIAFETYTIAYNRISYILLGIDGVIDYSSLSINGGTDNITISESQVPVIGTVVIS